MLHRILSILRPVADEVETVAERLSRLRSERGLSIADLARAARTTEGAIRSLLIGRSKAPQLMTGLRLAKALGVSAWYIAAGRDYDPEETELRSLEAVIRAQEHQALEIAALDRRVSRLEGQGGGGPPRTAPG
jgi:transcriptional regulator with XRE-family HTH domain